ncbi:YqiA/YcfP family alpha/beta fold hydrolase [Ghiorsea bivora]|uniref:YqiA/YcfP family alpha/beta fold hydrolase n=1 Tax=Ghiorsea bivora TaxID=1485545 RepID=UPI00068C760B|nr:YqiA/YcfP family alpha/beta fold hydrolase [Ghiorsea bivora]
MSHDLNDSKIYMIHGFASGPKYPNAKADIFEAIFKLPVQQIAYDSAATFAENMEALQKQIEDNPAIIIGTSLGAFYASKLAEQYAEQVKLLLMLNPCHTPSEILKHAVGEHENFATGKSFGFSSATLQSYAETTFIDESITLNRQVMLNMDDDLIDSQRTMDLFGDVLNMTSFTKGGHRFENLGDKEVTSFLQAIKPS